MKIDSDMLYGPCPCGSGKKFKFCCWQKCRDSINPDMTRAEVVQTVRCEAAGVYKRTDVAEADELLDKGMAEYKAGNDEKGRDLFRKARTLDPKMWTAWNNEAVCAWELGDVEGAYDAQLSGVKAFPERNTFGAACLAMYSHVLGRDGEALEWINRALADKLPISRDAVVQVCRALALFRRHREIVEYASASGMDDDELVAFYKGTALANLGETSRALASLEIASDGPYGGLADKYVDTIKDEAFPFSAYDGDWPYFWEGNFPPVKWFDEDLKAGRDPFARYPNVAVDAIEVLISDDIRRPSEMLKLIEGRDELGMARLRDGLRQLIDEGEEDDESNAEPDGPPEGVVVLQDEDRLPLLPPKPKWRKEYTVQESDDEDDGVYEILDNFVRPYADRYCSLADHGDPEKLEIAIQIVRYRKGSYPVDCPTLTIGGYSQIWNMLRHEIEEFLDNQSYGKLICEVRHDIMFGGPLLYLENEEGDIELFTVAIPDRFEESN